LESSPVGKLDLDVIGGLVQTLQSNDQLSVYWKPLTASYLFGLVPNVPGLLASRAQTEMR
jgi:hypothetical protein